VIDLGFGGFLEKFEQHFGSGLTKALLVVIGLAVATLCGSVIWTYLLLPLALMIPDPRSGPAYQVAKLILIVAIFLMITNQLIALFDNWVKRKIRRQMRETLATANEVSNNAQETLRKAHEAYDRAERVQKAAADTLAAADLAMEQALAVAVGKELITQEQADELRALRNAPPNVHWQA